MYVIRTCTSNYFGNLYAFLVPYPAHYFHVHLVLQKGFLFFLSETTHPLDQNEQIVLG